MRKLWKVGGVVLLVALLVCGASLADDEIFGQVAADGVNMRAKADSDSEVICELSLGMQVEVLAEEGNWYRILYDGSVGYISKTYLFVSSQGSRGGYVLEDGVIMRGGPDQASYEVMSLKAGQGVKITQMIDDWYFITVGDQCGYVHRSYITMTMGSTATATMLKMGMEGAEVKRMQQELYQRGFLDKSEVTGVYGAKTRTAVTKFQEAADLSSADGVAGQETLTALYDSSNGITEINAAYNRIKGTVVMMDWFEKARSWLPRGARFTVTDVRTGLTYRARRTGGTYHADVEPITAADTAIMYQIYGRKWSWSRRAVWVTYNGKSVAASQNGMPHSPNPTLSNNFPGHYCIHFLNSKTHIANAPCPVHQSKVREAYNKGKAGN